MISKSKGSEPQTQTAHVTRHHEGKRYRVWLGLSQVGSSDSLTTARRRAASTKARELAECWQTGKTFERTPRGGWKMVEKN